MRPIEFRGMRADTGEWVYGDLVHNAFDGTSRNIPIGIKPDNSYPIEVIPETVGQFTGLVDRNGKKIFEGDKVVYPSKDCDGQFYKDTYSVTYQKVEFMLSAIKSHIWKKGALIHMHNSEDIEIIGTIHDTQPTKTTAK